MTYTNNNAPLQLCPICHEHKRDWGFKYHRACSPCFGKQRRLKIAEQKRRGFYNNNRELSSGIVVTDFVKRRLVVQANKNLPMSDSDRAMRFLTSLPIFLHFITFFVGLINMEAWGFLPAMLFIISPTPFTIWGVRTSERLEAERKGQVNVEVERLAQKRREDMEATRMFYGSAEWRLLRAKIMQEHKNICVMCHTTLREADITVDHIMPRSKYPNLSLDAANMQILCRSCNSSKGARVMSF